ncbi:hypothetical protein CPB85DRAFT_1484946 [Mucidula mucida]|nr:hypothetical protein CPB85DRAFT_1484946 [Mucidula mucida]
MILIDSGFDSSPTSEDTTAVGTDNIHEQHDVLNLANKLQANNPDSLSAGIIRTTKNRTEFTILLVGETGVGKTSFLSLLANILEGHRPEEFIQAHLQTNEAGGSHTGSQTQKATVYEFQSRNGIIVRIMDTPGLADTRGLAMDELNKKSIAEAIQHHITSIHAVIILANGTLARLGIATDYALTTLSAIFPRSLEKNISFLFTNVNNPLQWNFQEDTIPQFLRDADRFTLDNPFSMEMRLRALCDMPQKAAFVKRMKAAVSNTYTETIDELTLLFNWMNELEPQPTKEILTLYQQVQEIEMRIGDALASMEQDSTKRKQVELIQADVAKHGVNMKTYQAYEKVISRPVWSQKETPRHNTLCTAPGCYSNCHEPCKPDFSLDPKVMYACGAMKHGRKCKHCTHAPEQHRRCGSGRTRSRSPLTRTHRRSIRRPSRKRSSRNSYWRR